jgi:hypothetical protein
MGRFQRLKKKLMDCKFILDKAVIPTMNFQMNKYFFLGNKLYASVIRTRVGFSTVARWAVFEVVEMKLLGLKFILDAAIIPTMNF